MPRYRIESQGNGAFYTVTRLADGAHVFFQGDDALAFGKHLETTHAGYSDDDVCAQYDDVMSVQA